MNEVTALITAVLGGIVFTAVTAGCQLQNNSCERTLAVESRFTANPLSTACDGAMVIAPQSNPSVKVGLAMQSSVDPVHVQFASRLGTVLSRELQLSPGSLVVQPLASLPVKTVIPTIQTPVTSDVITVSFQDSQNALPPQLPPSLLFMTPPPPLVDQILVIRVMEYKPYFPMLATLEIRVLDGETQDLLFTTTATWSGKDYRLAACQPKKKWPVSLFCRNPSCDPSPEHNSPQALMHEISRDITTWYFNALNPPPPVVEKKKLTARDWLWYPEE